MNYLWKKKIIKEYKSVTFRLYWALILLLRFRNVNILYKTNAFESELKTSCHLSFLVAHLKLYYSEEGDL